MRRDNPLFRLAAIAAMASLSAPLIPPARAQAPSDEVSPPARVGALTRARGTVSFHAAGAESWSPAAVNYPVTSGEGFWTEPGAEARIDLSATDLVMNSATEIEVNALDEHDFVATLPQGEAFLRLRGLMQGETYTLVTPRGAVTIAAPGRYAVMAGDTETPTRITVLEGTATLADGLTGNVAAGQAAEIRGTEAPFQVQLVAAARDPFIDHVLDEERPRPAPVRLPPLVAEMPGGAELADYGAWSQTPDYGEVWYPEVHPGWVPYRDGHWAYVAPWGWTWVDAAPWGFAPFHYGRWVDVGGRWAWAPGRSEPVAEAPSYPVYAPALVTFFGIGAAVGVTAALLSSGSVGWVPLGPGEVYRPWFHAGARYERDVNIRNVTNISQITNVVNSTTTNNVTINQLRNVTGATVVPAAAMAASRPVASEARPATPQMLAAAQPVVGRPPVPPTMATAGVTPAVARAVHAVPPPAGTAPPHPAPGPIIRAQTPQAGASATMDRRVAAPLLPHGGTPTAPLAPAVPGSAATPHQAAVPTPPAPAAVPHPVATAPALRPPGARPPAHPAEVAPAPGHALPSPAAVPQGTIPQGTIPQGTIPQGVIPQGTPRTPPPAHTEPAAHVSPVPAPVPHQSTAPHLSPPASSAAAPASPAAHPPALAVLHPPAAPTAPHPPAPHPPAPPSVQAPPVAPIVHPQAPAAPVFHPPAPAPTPAVHPAPAPAPHPEPAHLAAAPPGPHPAAPPPPVAHAAPAPHPPPHQDKRPGQA